MEAVNANVTKSFQIECDVCISILISAASSTNPGVVSKYQAGYNECAGEVARYLTTVEGINTEMRVRLLNHLANCFQSNNNNNNTPPPQFPAQNTTPPVQNQTPITAPSSLIQSFNTSASLPQISTLSATMITGAFRVLPAELQFVSGSVPAGDVAFLLPTQSLYFENSNQEGRALYPLPLSIGTQDGSVTAPATGPESKRKDPSPAKQCNPTIENVAIVKDNNNVNKKVVHDNQSLAPIHDALGLHRDNNNMNVLSNNSEMWRPW